MWIAPFCGVNESTWEHMKLLFWPVFIFAVTESFFFRDRPDFWCVKLRGILLGLILIPAIYYFYNGAFGKSPDWANILIFFVSAALAFLYEKRKFGKCPSRCRSPLTAFAILTAVALCFVVFTFRTPKLNIFRDPLTGTYGI